MSSEKRATRQNQKQDCQRRLERRLALLKEKGAEPQTIAKDRGVRKLRAEIRKTEARLRVIQAKEGKTEQMAVDKANKAETPEPQKGKKQNEKGEKSEASKRQQKKKAKKQEKAAQPEDEAEE
jgi:hypothetical protein